MRAPDLDEGHERHQRERVTRRRTRSSKRVRRARVRLQEPDCPAHVVEASMVVVDKAGALPRPRTHVGQAGRQQPRRALHLWPRASGWTAVVSKGTPPSRWVHGSVVARLKPGHTRNTALGCSTITHTGYTRRRLCPARRQRREPQRRRKKREKRGFFSKRRQILFAHTRPHAPVLRR